MPGIDTPNDALWTRRRAALVLGTALCGFLGAREMASPLTQDGIDLFDAAYFLLFFALFAWISFGFLTALAGFFSLMSEGPGLHPTIPVHAPLQISLVDRWTARALGGCTLSVTA